MQTDASRGGGSVRHPWFTDCCATARIYAYNQLFLLYYGCGSPYWISFLKTMTVTGPAHSQDHKNQFRSALHVLFLTDLSVYFPSLVLNEPSGIKHHSGLNVLVWSVCWTFCWNPNEKWDKKRRKEQSDRQQKKKWISGDGCWAGYDGPGRPCWGML